MDEGSNWEAAAAAAQFGLSNLALFVDYNGLQISGPVEDVMNFMPVTEKFRSFGWSVREINGNDMSEIVKALDALPFEEGKPSMILAHTVKGKGVSFAEGKASYHYWTPSEEELETAIRETEAEIRRLEAVCGEVRV